MINKDIRFTCDDCKHSWKGSEYNEEEDQVLFHDGHRCPKCDSTEISGEDL